MIIKAYYNKLKRKQPRRYPKRNIDEEIRDWEPIGAHGQIALFKRTWKHYCGKDIRFKVMDHPDWGTRRIFAITKKGSRCSRSRK